MYDTTSAISQRFYRVFIMIPETPGIALLNQNPFICFVIRGRTRARAREGEIARTIDRWNDSLDKRGQEWHVE